MRSIAFASGKGGVGKSSVALNLGLILAQAGKKVVVVDADLDMAAISILLGIELNPITLHNVLAAENDVSDAVYEGPNKLYYVPSSLQEEGKELDFTRLRAAVSKLELTHDFIIIDSPPGLRDEAQAAIASARELVLIVTPDPASVIDSLKVKRFAERNGVKVTGLVINRATGEKTELRPSDLESVLGIPVLAILPEDAEVRKSGLLQVPAAIRVPSTPFIRALRKLASEIAQEQLAEERIKTGLFQRIKGFFSRMFGRK
ncbi:P-loop NTPase [Candidatus Micrarchaeota archaeon]|nr:P-loop NTPase [Candidatus Micrarchaeota archaeon]